MELGKYIKAMRPKKYLNREFVVYDSSLDTGDEQLDTNDNVTIETKPGFFPDMSGSTPPMDKVMPSFNGLEDPRMRQIELAGGGVVQREGFAEGTMKEQVNRFKDILNPQEIEAINQSLNFKFNPMEFGKHFSNGPKIVKNAMLKIGRVALALELPLELAVEAAFMANAIAGGNTFREAWADSLIGYLDPTLYKDGMFTGPKISGDDLKNLKLDISQSARTNIELEKSDETLQSLKDELESGLSMLNLEGVDEATTSEDYNPLRERIRNEQNRNDKLREGTSEASKLELDYAKTEFEAGRSANSFSTWLKNFASKHGVRTDVSGLNYDLAKAKNEDGEVKERNFDTVEDQANFFINNFSDIKKSYEKNKDLFATPAEFYSALREQNPEFNEGVINFMMKPGFADEGTRGLDPYIRVVDQPSKVYATGGRVGFEKGGKPPKDNPIIPVNPMMDEGPQDPGKRTFLKGMGALGLGAAAIGTGIIKIGKALKTKTALKVLANPAVGQAEWFAPLVDKILLKGIRLEKDGKKLNTHVLKENNKTLTLTETDTSINIKVEGGGAYDDPFDVDYLKPGEHLGRAGRYQIEKPTFQISESRPQYYSSGPEDIELELSEHVATGSKFSKKPVEELLELRKGHSGILSDVEGLEKIAMGKVKDSKLAKKRGEVRDKLNKKPTEDRYTNTEQYYDDIDQIDTEKNFWDLTND
jgi:hypothetical protein